jgi:ABC-type antimicrobial peptide transport system permease subunit
MIMEDGLRLVAWGAALGFSVSLMMSRTLKSLLYGVTAYDPATYIAVLVLIAGISVIAALAPSRRATKVDPLIALREE